MHPLIQRLKERKLVQWALAYLAGAWMIVQAVGEFADRWGIPVGVQQNLDVLLTLGFGLTLVLAWYHGEQGRQRVSGPELLMIGGIFALTAAVLSVVGTDREAAIGGVEGGAVATVLRDRPAIAVLPFTNMSADEENAYFAQGIHDDLLTQLSKISALDVIARTSVMQYAATEKTIPVIAEELGVETVVEGGVQRVGNRVRINVQLIQAESNTHLWAETYDRELSAENIFAIQSEIAQQIVDELRMTLTPEEGSRIARAATGSLTAYDFFLRGREAYSRYTTESNDQAIGLFREALARDPEYARAWAGLGDAFGLRAANYGLAAIWADSALVAGRRAIDLDPLLADAHKALGVAYASRGETAEALEHYLRAVELDPSYLPAVANLADLYFMFGAFEEFHRWSMRAFRLDPNFRLRRTQVAWSYWNLEEYDLAERWSREALALGVDEGEALTILSTVASSRGDFGRGLEIADSIVDHFPTSAYNYQTATWAALFAGDFERARSTAEQALRLDPSGVDHHWHYTITALGFTLLRTGETERGMELLADALERTEAMLERDETWTPVWEMASIHAARGDLEEAIRWAEQAYEANDYRFPRFIEIDPVFDGVRGDPRFRALVARMASDVAETRRRIAREEVAAGLR